MKLFQHTKKNIILLMLLCGHCAQGQYIEYTKLMKFNPRNMGVIMNQNVLKGYYFFYNVGESNEETAQFKVQLLDVDLHITSEFKVERNKKTELLEVAYSGNAILLLFFDRKIVEFASYDFDGNELGTKQIPEPEFDEKMRLTNLGDNNKSDNSVIQNIGTIGFLRNTLTGTQKNGFELEALNLDLSSKWIYGSKGKLKTDESLDLLLVSTQYVALAHNRRQNTTLENVDSEFFLLNAETGAEVFKMSSLQPNGKQLSFQNCYIDITNNIICITGEYFNEKSNMDKVQSDGLYIKKIALNGGEPDYKEFGWEKELQEAKSHALSITPMINYEDADKIWVHDILFSNGHIYAIGEQYQRQISIGNIAMNSFANTPGSSLEMKITNLILIEFDEKMNIANFEIIQKKKRITDIYMQTGFESSKSNAQQLVEEGKFGYLFSLHDPQNQSYHVIYTDHNRKIAPDSKEKSDGMLGVIEIIGGEKKIYKKPFNTESYKSWVLPAKPGYVMIGEYFSDNRRVVLKLEKLASDN